MPTILSPPRVALCTDTYDEINGVATISQQFVAFAQRRQLPLLLVRPGPSCRSFHEGSVTFVDVSRSLLSLPLDMGIRFDLLIPRHYSWLREQLAGFGPDIIHICGPGDIGMLCAALSHYMRVPKIPLVAAWHTNVHQYARLRMAPLLRLLPTGLGKALSARIEAGSLRAAARFYQIARLILAPNAEILSQLTRLTGKPGTADAARRRYTNVRSRGREKAGAGHAWLRWPPDRGEECSFPGGACRGASGGYSGARPLSDRW